MTRPDAAIDLPVSDSLTSDGPRLLVQFVRYGFFGFVSLLVLMAVVVTLGYTVLPAFDPALEASLRARNLALCNLAGFFLANLAAYIGNRLYVFVPGRHNAWLEFALFTAVSGAGFAVGMFAGPLMIRLYGLDSWLAQVATLVSSGLCNFICRKYFIFSR